MPHKGTKIYRKMPRRVYLNRNSKINSLLTLLKVHTFVKEG